MPETNTCSPSALASDSCAKSNDENQEESGKAVDTSLSKRVSFSQNVACVAGKTNEANDQHQNGNGNHRTTIHKVEEYQNSNHSLENSGRSRTPPALSLISLKPGLQRKASPQCISSWAKLMLTLDGRDKLTKVVQYSCRLLVWYWSCYFSSQKDRIRRFRSLQKSLTEARKAFRLGRVLVEVDKLQKLWPVLCRSWSSQCKDARAVPFWHSVATACKIVSLGLFWMGDNVVFLASSGFLDPSNSKKTSDENKTSSPSPVLQLKTRAQKFSARSYFGGALVGLCLSWTAWRNHAQRDLKEAWGELWEARRMLSVMQQQWNLKKGRNEKYAHAGAQDEEEAGKGEEWDPLAHDSDDDLEERQAWEKEDLERAQERIQLAIKKWQGAQQKQFTLFLALLKSCCDTMVFSNMPGVDLHQRFRGKKMSDGWHCTFGLMSASTVLYNNFPNHSQAAPSKKDAGTGGSVTATSGGGTRKEGKVEWRRMSSLDRKRIFWSHRAASSNGAATHVSFDR